LGALARICGVSENQIVLEKGQQQQQSFLVPSPRKRTGEK
jgi:hypothetical protein